MFLNTQFIDVGQTHVKLSTDLKNNNLKSYIMKIRRDLESYINLFPDFSLSLDKINNKPKIETSEIVNIMYIASDLVDVGPMAGVAGSIAELSLNYLINKGSKNSIVDNGGDIAIINSKKVICGIYSNNTILNNQLAFQIKENKTPLGICTSSGKIGHSISFGDADSVTVISNNASLADCLATRIANEVKGEDPINNALECCENYRELFKGVLIIGTIGKLPKLVETDEFDLGCI